TVQLPLRNERFVAERLLRLCAALDWPRDRMEVQVLDDSDDETRAVVDETAAELGRAGLQIEVLRRQDRRGYKAGALQLGLERARGAYLLVLDADFQPAPDLLRRLMGPLLEDPRLAFVQGRWSFDNEDENLLCRLQALILHGLMAVEEARLSARG